MNREVNAIDDLSTFSTKVNSSGVYVLIINNQDNTVRRRFYCCSSTRYQILHNQFVQRPSQVTGNRSVAQFSSVKQKQALETLRRI